MGERNQKISLEKAEILGLLCAEGTHYKYIAKYWGWSRNPDKKRFREQLTEGVNFSNSNSKVMNRFRILMDKTYGYSPKVTGTIYNRQIQIKKKSVVRDILNHTDIGSLKWTVPNEILNADKKIMASFIRGLYEGDGTIPMKTSTKYFLYFNMKNFDSLKLVGDMLDSLGIKTRFWKNETENMHKLVVYGNEDVLKFKKAINPRIKIIKIAGATRR